MDPANLMTLRDENVFVSALNVVDSYRSGLFVLL